MMVRCLIVDDSPRFLRSARSLLEHQGITVVGVASTAVIRPAAKCAPSVPVSGTYVEVGCPAAFP